LPVSEEQKLMQQKNYGRHYHGGNRYRVQPELLSKET
jgi:hypothetical protein